MKTLLVLGIALLCMLPVRISAVDPVTVTALAPIALNAASVATPLVIRCVQTTAVQMVNIGRDIVGIFRLPLGIGQTVLGWPFGYFGAGVKNMAAGAVAPLKLVKDAVLLPVSLVGISAGGIIK